MKYPKNSQMCRFIHKYYPEDTFTCELVDVSEGRYLNICWSEAGHGFITGLALPEELTPLTPLAKEMLDIIWANR